MLAHKPQAYTGRAVALPSGSGAVAVPGDAAYNNVVLLMHCNGAQNSNVFTHNGPTSRTLTAGGNAQQRHDVRWMGVGAGFFDGVGDFVSTDFSADFNFGSGDWTIEFDFLMTSFANANPHLFSIVDSVYANVIRFHTTNAIQKLIWTVRHGGTSHVDATAVSSIVLNKWYRCAATRQGNVHRLFINGALEASVTVAHTIPTQNQQARLGDLANEGSDTYRAACYLDEIRVTKGLCRYDAAYTPSLLPFPDSL